LKKILLLLICFGAIITSCDKLPTHPEKDDKSDVSLIAVVVDPPDEPAECELTNTDWESFTNDVKALFTDEEIALIEEALGEPISCSLLHCFEDNFNNHGGFVSCMAHWTNTLKKAKVISGKEKGIIMNISARSNIGK
jgi:hypothetical protein